MPVPGGEITSTDTWTAPAVSVEEAIEIIKEEDSELLERLEDEDDLPELS